MAEWWLGEVADDPAYETEITPVLMDLLRPQPHRRYLDLGCGEGRLMKEVGASGAAVVGVDVSAELARRASAHGPVALGRIPDLGFIAPDIFDGAFSVLVLEHLDAIAEFFTAVANVVRDGGVLVVVSNHPTWTAPESSPIADTDGEILWRPGGYFDGGYSDQAAGSGFIRFHHRSTSELVNAAATAGWSLEEMQEAPHPAAKGQEGIPRVLGVRWRRM